MISATPQVKSSPILFSAPMVRAILEGRKTQTRRIIKPQPPSSAPAAIACEWYEPTVIRKGMQESGDPVFGFWNEDDGWKCPYGAPGSELWVRETWRTGCKLDEYSPKQIREKFEYAGYRLGDRRNGKCCPMLYPADGEHKRWGDYDIADFGEWGKTRVSIHMPRWASRITLEITGVRVERLNDISESDAKAEGVCVMGVENPAGPMRVHQRAFGMLWESINGHGSWNANPWVWVVEFRRVEQ